MAGRLRSRTVLTNRLAPRQPTLSHSMSINDDGVAPLMRLRKEGVGVAGLIEAGECSTAGLSALLATRGDPAARAALDLDEGSTVLVFGPEGATDPDVYRALIGEDAPAMASSL
jgi:diaminopropionate ammonia-lyase